VAGRAYAGGKPSLQHEVKIEAVENHTPEVIVIDEIGRESKRLRRAPSRARVQLIGTAHGRTQETCANPTCRTCGGIESVTLSDEEATRRGTQKRWLERPPPADLRRLIEIKERVTWSFTPMCPLRGYLLRGYSPQTEVRYRNSDDEVVVEKATARPWPDVARPCRPRVPYAGRPAPRLRAAAAPDRQGSNHPGDPPLNNAARCRRNRRPLQGGDSRIPPVLGYPYGLARNRLMQAANAWVCPGGGARPE
jgi:hypothetical protein